MLILRRAALSALWLLAAVGVLCGLMWCATAAGLLKPLIVVSGSMEPEIMTGDLLIDVKVDTGSLQPGDVVSLRSDLTQDIVTHRIVSIRQVSDGEYRIAMKGDVNDASDPLDYVVGETVWQPTARLAGWGRILQRIATPAVAVPLVVGMLGLVGLATLIPAPVRRHRGTADDAAEPKQDALS